MTDTYKSLIIKFRKELEEDKKQLESVPEELEELSKMGVARIEQLVETIELQNEILHIMGVVITNCHNIAEKEPKKAKEVLGDAINRIKQLKTFFDND